MTDAFVLTLVIIGAVVAFGLSFAVGANDCANALGTSVGTRALTLKQAVALGGVFEFLGVLIMGSFVSNTLKSKVLSPNDFLDDQVVYVMGMFATMVACTLLLLGATVLGLPVSTTQTVVGGIIGFGLVAGAGGIKTETVTSIAISWLATPILGLMLGYVLYYMVESFILRHDDAVARSRRYAPYITALTIGVLGGFICSSQQKIFKFNFIWIPISFAISCVLGFISYFIPWKAWLSCTKCQNIIGGLFGSDDEDGDDGGNTKQAYTRSQPASPAAADPELEFTKPHSPHSHHHDHDDGGDGGGGVQMMEVRKGKPMATSD